MNQDFNLQEYPSIHWKKFFEKFIEIDNTNIDSWNAVHLIGYFCRKYKEYYNVDYTFKFNSSPSKSYEIYNLNKLSSMLSSNPSILKDYVDWFFQEKIIAKKRRITSMAFLTEANIVNEYKFKKLLMSKQSVIDRTTIIPPVYAAIIDKFGYKFTNYGHLSFLKRCVDAGNGEVGHKDMLNALAKAGLDLTALDKVK